MIDVFTNIILTDEQVAETIESLEKNKKYLVLNENLFTIENIMSCFSVVAVDINSKYFDSGESYVCFKFSYNDGSISKLFNVMVKFEETTVYSFLIQTPFMEMNQISDIIKKIYSFDVNDSKKLFDYDNDLYNEALIFITSGLNMDDSKKIKDDFESKYKIYKERQLEKNEKILKNVKELYSKLIKIKMD